METQAFASECESPAAESGPADEHLECNSSRVWPETRIEANNDENHDSMIYSQDDQAAAGVELYLPKKKLTFGFVERVEQTVIEKNCKADESSLEPVGTSSVTSEALVSEVCEKHLAVLGA